MAIAFVTDKLRWCGRVPAPQTTVWRRPFDPLARRRMEALTSVKAHAGAPVADAEPGNQSTRPSPSSTCRDADTQSASLSLDDHVP